MLLLKLLIFGLVQSLHGLELNYSVSSCERWDSPVIDIESRNEMFDITNQRTLNNILLLIYNEIDCNECETHIYFEGSQMFFGNHSVTLFRLNSNIDPTIFDFLHIKHINCSLIAFIPKNTHKNQIESNIKIANNQKNLNIFGKWIQALLKVLFFMFA